MLEPELPFVTDYAVISTQIRHRCPLTDSTAAPCQNLPPPHPQLHYWPLPNSSSTLSPTPLPRSLTYHHPPLPLPSFRRWSFPSIPTISILQRQRGQRFNRRPCIILHTQILRATKPIYEAWEKEEL